MSKRYFIGIFLLCIIGILGFFLFLISSIQRGQYLRLNESGYTRHIISFLQIDHTKTNRNDITIYSGTSDSYQFWSDIETGTYSFPKKATLSFEKCSYHIYGFGLSCGYQKISTQEHPLSCI